MEVSENKEEKKQQKRVRKLRFVKGVFIRIFNAVARRVDPTLNGNSLDPREVQLSKESGKSVGAIGGGC